MLRRLLSRSWNGARLAVPVLVLWRVVVASVPVFALVFAAAAACVRGGMQPRLRRQAGVAMKAGRQGEA